MLTHKGTRELRTQRLLLRKYAVSDAEDMFRNYVTDERVTRFLSWPPYKSADEVKADLSAQQAKYQKPDMYNWAIEFGGEMIGSIFVCNLDEGNLSCELGYGLGFDFWNMGIMSEALRAVMGFLFNEVGMHRIMAKHDVENTGSGKVMLKCGMRNEGRLRGYYLRWDGAYSDSLVYGILREDFI